VWVTGAKNAVGQWNLSASGTAEWKRVASPRGERGSRLINLQGSSLTNL
jgi:hypothetical protein